MIDKITITLIALLTFGSQLPASADTLPMKELPKEREALFSRDIAPTLKKNCVACHNANNEEGGVNLESVAQMKSSDVDDVLVPGKPNSSRLFLLASHADDPVMPPEDNEVSASILNPTELALLRRWIESGANVDETSKPTERIWQPLPPELQTVYGSAMTADGRLSAVSFGNQIRLFGSKSAQSIGVLEIDAGSETKPAHDDFVQDLFLDPTGRRVVSAGFRNVKLWEMAALEPTSTPEIDHDDVLAIAMNASGSHLAILSPRGELSVAKIGSGRWDWLKSIDVPDEFVGNDPPKVQLVVGADGQQAAIAWENAIRIVRVDGKEPESIDMTDAITSMILHDKDQFVAADVTGHVFTWKRNADAWVKTEHAVFDQAVTGLYAAIQDPARLVAIDASGKVANWNLMNETFEDAGKLPSPPTSISLSPDGTTLWMATAAGTFAKYSIADQKFAEIAKSDPVAEARLATDHWQMLIGEKLVAASDQEVKQAEANVKAEKESLKAFDKKIETKTKERDEKQASLVEAQKTAAAAAKKLAEAEKAVATIETELSKAVAALRLAKETQDRGENRLNGLNAELQRQQQTRDKVKADQKARKSNEVASKTFRDQSRAADTLAVMAGGTRILTRASDPEDDSANTWSLWSSAGDWLAELPGIPAGSQLIAFADKGVLIKQADGQIRALQSSSHLWTHQKTIGSSTGQSPFADRVLSIDVDHAGNLMATGGGNPSRSGELMIWKLSDGSLFRTIEKPHEDTVLCVRFSPDGTMLATGGADQMVKLWDVESGELIKTLEGHTHHVTAIAWNVNRRQLASGSADATVKIWDIDSGQAKRTISGLKTEVTKLVFVGRDDRIGVVGGDSYFRVYRTDNGTRETNAKVLGGYLYALGSNRDGSQFVIGGADGVAVVVDKSGKQLREYIPETIQTQ